MKSGSKKPADGGPKTPGWIVSFTDMITLLLAFFVLLQAFAKERHPELFFVGQGSFRRAIAGLGIPDLLFGKMEKPEQSDWKKKHPTEPDEEHLNRSRVLDAEDEKIRQLFADLMRNLETKSSDLRERPLRAVPAGIRFRSGQADLDAAARQRLREQALGLSQNLRSRDVKIYVVGLAPDRPDVREQWLLSARRARAVEEVLSSVLSAELHSAGWQIGSWGAGPGGPWCRKFGLDPSGSHILIAVMGAS